MPLVQVDLKSGQSIDQKRQLVKRITEVLVEVCASNPDRVHVIVNEVPAENWGHNGKLLSDK